MHFTHCNRRWPRDTVDWMSYRECIQVFHPVEVQAYLKILRSDFGAAAHPNEPRAFLVGQPSLPFHRPRLINDHLSILSFNYWPLSVSLILAFVEHPELAPETTPVRWLAEQDLIVALSLRHMTHWLKQLSDGKLNAAK